MRFTDEQRKRISEESKGKTIETMEWEPDDGGYWVMTFTDGTELSVRLMAEADEDLRSVVGKYGEGFSEDT